MAIFTRFGTKVALRSARLVPVWVASLNGETRWYYKEVRASSRRTVELIQVWHCTAEACDERPDHGPAGRMICDGREICVNEFRADDGIREIHDACRALNPLDADREDAMFGREAA